MNMLSDQSYELRKMAAVMSDRGSAIGLDYGMGRGLVDAARMMREAADTIEVLRKQVAKCQIAELKADYDTSRYFELFGTPERAAGTMATQCFGATSEACDTCLFDECDGKLRNSGTYQTVYDALLEWLGGESDGK